MDKNQHFFDGKVKSVKKKSYLKQILLQLLCACLLFGAVFGLSKIEDETATQVFYAIREAITADYSKPIQDGVEDVFNSFK